MKAITILKKLITVYYYLLLIVFVLGVPIPLCPIPEVVIGFTEDDQ